jgi:hypothetical protein
MGEFCMLARIVFTPSQASWFLLVGGVGILLYGVWAFASKERTMAYYCWGIGVLCLLLAAASFASEAGR